MRKLFELINSPVRSGHGLRVTFTSPASRGVARSLGRFKRWPVKMVCATQKMPDLVRNVGSAVSEPEFVAPVAAAPVDGPSNRSLANGLFQRTDPSTCVCRLCNKAFKQAALKGCDNLVRHLRLKHASSFRAEFLHRQLSAQDCMHLLRSPNC
jgi:hypothetical protein